MGQPFWWRVSPALPEKVLVQGETHVKVIEMERIKNQRSTLRYMFMRDELPHRGGEDHLSDKRRRNCGPHITGNIHRAICHNRYLAPDQNRTIP
jgi:hypothetical protein